MKYPLRSNLILAAVLLVLYFFFFLWQTPGLLQDELSTVEIEEYLVRLDQHLVAPPEAKQRFQEDLRSWGASDDGQPVYMVNLLRFRPSLERWAGGPDFKDAPNPQHANDLYERSLAPLALSSGVYPIFNGETQGNKLVDDALSTDAWDRVAVMRFPSRRVFFDWASDPEFGRLFAYKYAAVEIALVPATAELLLPDLRLVLGLLLVIVYLLVRRRHGGKRV